MASPKYEALLIRVPAGAAATLAASPKLRTLSAAGVKFELEPLFTTGDSGTSRDGIALAEAGSQWHIARPASGELNAHAWDAAHEAMSRMSFAGEAAFIEPDLLQPWTMQSRPVGVALSAAAVCAFDDQKTGLPARPGEFAWHLGSDFTQLDEARAIAADEGVADSVRIAHLDVGFDPNHITCPISQIDGDLQRNFIDGDALRRDARDPQNSGMLKNPGHGVATLALLAGGEFEWTQNGYQFSDLLGGAPQARIVPVRVGNSVVQIKTSSVAAGVNHAAVLCESEATRVHVLSMSMGGVASAAWADAVNKAYDAGIVLVTAAGNNISAGFFGFPARSIVYPARFRRVIAACGVMADRRPYTNLSAGTMQGNWGPDSKMATAISAFTPNTPWAQIGCPGLVDMDGEGTSSATPQVAALAALYLQVHGAAMVSYPERWMHVEAVREAMFASADRQADGGKTEKLGNGIIRAVNTLRTAPPAAGSLTKTRPDSASFSFLKVLSGLGVAATAQGRMLELEATQLVHRWASRGEPNPLEAAIADPDRDADDISIDERRRYLEIVESHPDASEALRKKTGEALAMMASDRQRPPRPPPKPSSRVKSKAPAAGAPAAPIAAAASPFTPPTPPFRRLRGFAIDPSLSTTFATAGISEVCFNVPWEELKPGPVGEYLEVVDIDPPSNCSYEPVDLDLPALLAQDGLPPSEGTPQFHQQMVYAVCSLTIRNFEQALGRRALWRHGPSPDPKNSRNDSRYEPRLRVYPHALREANAYYSPDKVAVLFGYFNARSEGNEEHLAGGRVFTCLSHDIVAHETTHALLDGMHRQFLFPSNRDVLAFHEAFADIVALFQHFTFPEILRHQIASTRGEIRSQESLLGALATQFGMATGLRGALRHGIGKIEGNKWVAYTAKPSDYEQAIEAHDRGSVLVGAVFDAFLAIYERRSADLMRLATGGSGVLRPGAIHPDLVNRLAAEAAKSAQHVLTMCIRALDYCPPTDITFGEFLRAIITADHALVPDDDLKYRVAFVEAFRKRGIFPRDLRTLSAESLLWRSPHDEATPPSRALEGIIERMREHSSEQLYAETREDVFNLQRKMRGELHGRLKYLFKSDSRGAGDAAFLGLDPNLSFEVHTARFAHRNSPDGDVQPQLLLSLLQEQEKPVDQGDPDGMKRPFRGGCTIVADLRSHKVQYCIRKSLTSATRLSRHQAFAGQQAESVRSVYFGESRGEPFAALHRGHS